MKQVPTIEMIQKIVEIVPQVQFLIEWWMCQLLMVCVSQCPDTTIQKCSGSQDTFEIVCVAGSKID